MGLKRKITTEDRSLQIISKSASFQYVEAYKMLRTNLNFITGASDAKVMAITSAIPMEGKSNIIINLAISLAEEGKQVLIIDADMRKPMLHKYLKIQNRKGGLSNVLSGKSELLKSMVRFKELSIYLLPSGPIPPNPTELLGGSRMETMLAEVRETFDYVLIDTPPVSVVTDAAVIGRLVDGVLLVIRQKFAKVEAVKLAKKNLESVGIQVLGVILNNFEVKNTNRGYDYYESYRYSYENEESEE